MLVLIFAIFFTSITSENSHITEWWQVPIISKPSRWPPPLADRGRTYCSSTWIHKKHLLGAHHRMPQEKVPYAAACEQGQELAVQRRSATKKPVVLLRLISGNDTSFRGLKPSCEISLEHALLRMDPENQLNNSDIHHLYND